jgi:hypothetical protein
MAALGSHWSQDHLASDSGATLDIEIDRGKFVAGSGGSDVSPSHEPVAHPSPILKARVAGALYLINIAAGIFTEVFVRDKFMVSGDAAATAHNIALNEGLYRLGLCADIVAIACAIIVTLLLYELLKPAGRSLALMTLGFSLASNVVEIVNLLAFLMPLIVMKAGKALAALEPGQVQAMALMALELHNAQFMIILTFFGFSCLFEGYLIIRSRFLPAVLGILILIAGVCYVVYSFATFIAPEFASLLVPYIQLASAVGETLLALWLLVFGVNASQWRAQAIISRVL